MFLLAGVCNNTAQNVAVTVIYVLFIVLTMSESGLHAGISQEWMNFLHESKRPIVNGLNHPHVNKKRLSKHQRTEEGR